MINRRQDAAVRAFLLTASWWKLVLLCGVPIGLFVGVASALVIPADPRSGWQLGLASGLAYGLIVGSLTAGNHRKVRAAMGPVPPDRYSEVLRAARRGPVPAHPRIRKAATRLVAWRLDDATSQRTWLLIGYVVFFVVAVYNAVVTSPVHWLTAMVWACALPARMWMQKRLRQRLALLTRPEV